MTAEQIIFYIATGFILVSALMVVTTRNLIHAALWLVATLFGVAVVYATLDASFLAVVQVVVYIGAIAIMFVFAVMLTKRNLLDHVPQTNANWPWAAGIAALVGAGLLYTASQLTTFGAQRPALSGDSLMNLGKALVSPDAFVLPFEAASILLLAALVGAVYLVNKR